VIQSGGIGNQFSISDSGATLHAGPGCSGGPGAVLCVVPSGGLPAYDVDLGDGNDTFDVRVNFPQRSVVNGGFGDDTFSGGPGAETFFGGDGVDTVTYASRTVTIGGSIGCDSGGLFCAPDGAQNENDSISNDIDKVIGGSGADGLASGPKTTVRHTLDGGAGNDFIAGNLGSDVLTGGSGQDTLSGFDGNDSLFARDGDPDTLSCGTGLDIAQIDLHDPPPPADCDSVDRAAIDQGPNVRIGPVRLAGRAPLVRLTCPRSPEGRCAGTLTLRRIVGTRGSAATPTTKSTLRLITRLLGSARYQIAIGYSATVHVPVAGVASGRIQVISVEPDANGRPKTTLATRTLQR
jgi:Ca2+-binding RTX toxin-like protein